MEAKPAGGRIPPRSLLLVPASRFMPRFLFMKLRDARLLCHGVCHSDIKQTRTLLVIASPVEYLGETRAYCGRCSRKGGGAIWGRRLPMDGVGWRWVTPCM